MIWSPVALEAAVPSPLGLGRRRHHRQQRQRPQQHLVCSSWATILQRLKAEANFAVALYTHFFFFLSLLLLQSCVLPSLGHSSEKGMLPVQNYLFSMILTTCTCSEFFIASFFPTHLVRKREGLTQKRASPDVRNNTYATATASNEQNSKAGMQKTEEWMEERGRERYGGWEI